MPHNERRLPIKVVIQRDGDLKPVPAGGSERKVFETATQDVRESLLGQVGQIKAYFHDTLTGGQRLPVVARVILRQDAIAKTHRPRQLFTDSTCPIIGGENFGRLLIGVTNDGLRRLEDQITHNSTRDIAADISTVAKIEPFTADDATGGLGVQALSQIVAKRKPVAIKLRLFRHRNRANDEKILQYFAELTERMRLPQSEPLRYMPGMRIHRVSNVTAEQIVQLARFVGVQSISLFPQFHVVSQYIPQGGITAERFPPPNPSRIYPLVGLIDSGTDRANPFLQAWVAERDEEDVPPADQDNNHGSFVAGLIINSHLLNHGDVRFPTTQAKVIDVVALPHPETAVDEDDLLVTIRRAVKKYRQVKVWNLSISCVDAVCRDDQFSDFAMALDDIQKEYDVTFVTCAGNYSTLPLRGWPPGDFGEKDRLFPPADTALGVSVGSLAHRDHSNTLVQKGEPSPFSRRGPGAAFLPKPEVAHYGGNCDASMNCHQVGVVSVNGNGQICEAIGTSFSTPLVTSILANLRAGVSDGISRSLAKALLIHSAALGTGELSAEHLRYTGFGVPGAIDTILTCAPWQATLIFEPQIDLKRRIFDREQFPIPACFRRLDGRVEGEVLMTLAYDPPLSPVAGAEYCQVNVDVSLGTYRKTKKGQIVYCGKIPLEPKNVGELYEENQVKHGFKWSPVKVYRKRLTAIAGDKWRIYLRVNYRPDVQEEVPQNVALVVTLFDPERQKPVYDDVVRVMARSGWVTEDLRVDERIRARL